MSEPRYEAYPNLFGVRPFTSLILLVVLVIGFLLVPAGRYLPPEIFTALIPGGDRFAVETIQYVGAGLFAAAGLLLFFWYALSRFERLRIMRDGIIWRRGFFQKHIKEIRFETVRDLRIDQNGIQRRLNMGDLVVFTAGDRPELVVRGLPYPGYIRDLILEGVGV